MRILGCDSCVESFSFFNLLNGRKAEKVSRGNLIPILFFCSSPFFNFFFLFTVPLIHPLDRFNLYYIPPAAKISHPPLPPPFIHRRTPKHPFYRTGRTTDSPNLHDRSPPSHITCAHPLFQQSSIVLVKFWYNFNNNNVSSATTTQFQLHGNVTNVTSTTQWHHIFYQLVSLFFSILSSIMLCLSYSTGIIFRFMLFCFIGYEELM